MVHEDAAPGLPVACATLLATDAQQVVITADDGDGSGVDTIEFWGTPVTVEIDPENFDAWRLGGVLLVDHLGMLEDGIRWWEARRAVAPYEVTPLIEQIGILVRLGYYEECASLIEELFSERMDATDSKQLARMEDVRRMVSRAAKT